MSTINHNLLIEQSSPSSVATGQSEGNLFTGVNPNVFGSVANDISNVAGVDANSAQSFLNFFQSNRDYNNAWSASQARLQREWQEVQNAKAMEFNANEAAKNRDWQQMMSNTAHQREVADLQAAGLNPILSAMNGNGAAVTSGATASGVSSSGASGQTDTSMNHMLVTLLGSFLDAQTKLQQSSMSAISNMAVAEKQGEISHSLANLNGIINGNLNYNKYLYDRDLGYNNYMYNRNLTEFNRSVDKDIAKFNGDISKYVSNNAKLVGLTQAQVSSSNAALAASTQRHTAFLNLIGSVLGGLFRPHK